MGIPTPEMELMLKGNFFLGLSAVDSVPDYSTISRFRSDLKSMNFYRAASMSSRAKALNSKLAKLLMLVWSKRLESPGKDDDAYFTKKEK